MKKVIFVLLVFGLVFAFASPVQAQDKKVGLFFNAGVLTDDSFSFDPFFFYGGINLDLHLGDSFMLSPEVNIISHKFEFDPIMLEPACLLNIKLGDFFVGGGIYKYLVIVGDEVTSSDFGLKLNAGIVSNNLRLRVFLNTTFEDAFKYMLVGAQIGIGF